MLNWKVLLLSLSTFTLIGCGSQTDGVSSESADESQATEIQESKAESVTVENIDEDQSVEDGETEDNSQENDTADEATSATEEDSVEMSQDSSSETDVTPEVTEEISLQEPQDGKDLNIVEAVAAADSTLPEGTQFLIEPLSDTIYQVEARQDGADSSVSTLLGLYQYDMETGEIVKQDPTTGEFAPL